MAFVVTDGDRKRFRSWGDSGPEWTASLDDALQFARRRDAERFCENDEDAWYVCEVDALRDALARDLRKTINT